MVENNVRYEYCPLCRSELITRVGNIMYEKPVHFSTSNIELVAIPELWKCHDCDSSFVQNILPEDMAVSLYSQGESQERWSRIPFQQQKPEKQIKCLLRYFNNGKRVLDIGCNTGELLDFARSVGCETAGIEYSESSREILKSKNQIAFSSMSEINQKFDVITAFDLVEHLYDMSAFFLNCKNMLKRGGKLIILTGNIESLSAKLCKTMWWYLRYPEHIAFPSKKYLVRYSGFLLEEWVRTYASKGYQYNWPKVLLGLAGGVVRGCYNGLPSIGPDHVLAVLQNNA